MESTLVNMPRMAFCSNKAFLMELPVCCGEKGLKAFWVFASQKMCEVQKSGALFVLVCGTGGWWRARVGAWSSVLLFILRAKLSFLGNLH